MESPSTGNPALTIALALAAGIICQALARHLRIPGIVLLLLAGLLLGPDGAGLVRPESIQAAVHALIGFAVAVILFEGGMNLNIRRLRAQAGVIQRLITIGALVTAIGGTLAARGILGWEWRLSMAFGALVIVTGPTVITPILRRTKVRTNLQTILEAEGVFIDAIGAILAILALQLALRPSGATFAAGMLDVMAKIAFGTVFGFAGGALISLILRPHRVIPEGLENIFTLSVVFLLFQVSNAILPESGLATATVAGVVVGNLCTRVLRDMLEFKEQLTVLSIGMLFVLLAADVRVADVSSLGWAGIGTVLALMFLVRPANIIVSTFRSGLSVREKAFLSWLAPRGIVAAAIASIFAQTLQESNVSGGPELRAMVFLVIATTVLVQGLSGGWVARRLGVRRPSDVGYAILGANDIGLALARALSRDPKEIVFLDTDTEACRTAGEQGFRVIFGNALEEGSLYRAQVDTRAGVIAVTINEEVNFLFARIAKEEFKVRRVHVGLEIGHRSVSEEMVRRKGAGILFGTPRDLELWDVRLRRGVARVEVWMRSNAGSGDGVSIGVAAFPDVILLPMVYLRGGKASPVDERAAFREGDILHLAVLQEERSKAEEWLRAHGWEPLPPVDETPGPA